MASAEGGSRASPSGRLAARSWLGTSPILEGEDGVLRSSGSLFERWWLVGGRIPAPYRSAGDAFDRRYDARGDRRQGSAD